MKKTLGLMLALVALSLGGVCFAQSAVNSQRDQVTFDVNVLAGDEAAAEGLVVESKNHLNNRLFWNTVYAPGAESVVQTEFTFSNHKVYDVSAERGAYLSLSNDTSQSVDMEMEPAGLGIAWQELMDETAPGEENTRIVALKDYCDYYPIQISIDLPNCWLDTSIRAWMYGEDWTDEELEKLDQAVNSFFKLPVQNERLQLSIRKDKDGNVVSTSEGSWDGDAFYLGTWNVVLPEACYFVFDAHTAEGNLVDTSQIAGGFGIYRLPYEVDEEGTATVQPEELATAYPLDPDMYLVGLYTDVERTKLLLLTMEDEVCVFTVIDGRTMETLQRLELPQGRPTNVFLEDDFLVLGLSGEDQSLALLTLTEDGTYALRFVVELGEEWPAYFSQYTASLDWDGERLAVADNLRTDRWREECGFYLVVYDGDGQVLYGGEYPSSLSVGDNDEQYYGNASCSPRENTPITVRWDG